MSVRKDSYVWVGVGGILIAILLVAAVFIWRQHQTATLRLGDGVFMARIAATDSARATGLGGVSELDPDEAMLFVYDSDGQHDIWMKDMLLPIDAVWLDSAKRVVHIERSLQPESYPMSYGPERPTRYIVELPDGTVDKKVISIGMQANFNEERGGRE